MNPEHYPLGLNYGWKVSTKDMPGVKRQRALSKKWQPVMDKMKQGFAEHLDRRFLEALKESEGQTEKKWKPVLPAWEWSGLSLARAVKYCEKKGCKA